MPTIVTTLHWVLVGTMVESRRLKMGLPFSSLSALLLPGCRRDRGICWHMGRGQMEHDPRRTILS